MMQTEIHVYVLFIWFDSLRPSQTVGMGLSGLNQYQAMSSVSCSMTQRSDTGKARIRNPNFTVEPPFLTRLLSLPGEAHCR